MSCIGNFPCCVNCPSPQKEYALFSQSKRLYNTGRLGGVLLDNPPVQTKGFQYNTGIIYIINPGAYLLQYIVNIPENVTLNTAFVLQHNNQNVSNTVRVVNKTGTGTPCTITAQGILQISPLSVIRLSSFQVVDFTSADNDVVASLSIVQL